MYESRFLGTLIPSCSEIKSTGAPALRDRPAGLVFFHTKCIAVHAPRSRRSRNVQFFLAPVRAREGVKSNYHVCLALMRRNYKVIARTTYSRLMLVAPVTTSLLGVCDYAQTSRNFCFRMIRQPLPLPSVISDSLPPSLFSLPPSLTLLFLPPFFHFPTTSRHHYRRERLRQVVAVVSMSMQSSCASNSAAFVWCR